MRMTQTSLVSFKKRRSILLLGAFGIIDSFTGMASFAQQRPARPLDVPYQPSPQYVVDKMLDLARLKPDDVLYDLGCGDGRIVITAAKKYGARGIGIDLDPQRVAEARANAKKAAVEDRVHFMVGDLYESDFSDATVVTLFLWPQVNLKLRSILWRQLTVGARVVSYIWDMGPAWPPDKTKTVHGKKIYCWTITEAHKKASDSLPLALRSLAAANSGV